MNRHSKLLTSLFVFSIALGAKSASASSAAANLYDTLGKAGVPDIGGTGKTLRSVSSISCAHKQAPGQNIYSCELAAVTPVSLSTSDSLVVYRLISQIAGAHCTTEGDCTTMATDISCSQVSESVYDPSHVPSARERTTCRMKVDKVF
jgi:hypothetical protein